MSRHGSVQRKFHKRNTNYRLLLKAWWWRYENCTLWFQNLLFWGNSIIVLNRFSTRNLKNTFKLLKIVIWRHKTTIFNIEHAFETMCFSKDLSIPVSTKASFINLPCDNISMTSVKNWAKIFADCYLRQGDGGTKTARFGSKTCFSR